MGVKGYKVFNPDWTCRKFKYEVGKTYEHKGEIELCKEGFHFCENLLDCFEYYGFEVDNKVAEIEAIGDIKSGKDKSVTDKIKIVKELTWYEVFDLVNTGKYNTGYSNSGNYNSGDYNAGDCNSGDYNTGHSNSGDYNTGDYNAGNYNTGDYNANSSNVGDKNVGYHNVGHRNVGDYNSGNDNVGSYNSGACNIGHYNAGDCNIGNCNTEYGNVGDYNSGSYNIGNYNSGVFNTGEQKIYMFNKPSDWTYNDWLNSKARTILETNSELTKWIRTNEMTEEERIKNPTYNITGGYLKRYTYKEMWQNTWKKLGKEEREIIMQLPNFDKDIFKEITGIDVN